MPRTMERTTITMPPGLRDKAHLIGVNISRVASIAVSDAVKRLEENTEPSGVR